MTPTPGDGSGYFLYGMQLNHLASAPTRTRLRNRATAGLIRMKFLISAPGQNRPKRARAHLLTNEVVAAAAARYAITGPGWMRHPAGRLILLVGLSALPGPR